jgi:hypothetical protein
MIIFTEKSASAKMVEADDKTVQKLAWDLFEYLSVRDVPKGQKAPDFDETVRKAHASQFRAGIKEFASAASNYLSGYARSMAYDEKKYKADYGSEIYKKLSQDLAKI